MLLRLQWPSSNEEGIIAPMQIKWRGTRRGWHRLRACKPTEEDTAAGVAVAGDVRPPVAPPKLAATAYHHAVGWGRGGAASSQPAQCLPCPLP